METKVDKCSVDRKYFEIEKKELFIENEHHLEQIIFQDIMCTAMHSYDDLVKYADMEKSYIDEYRMFKLDLPPLSPKLKKNKETHVDYLKQTKEHANTLHEILEQARALKPLDNALDYAGVDLLKGSRGTNFYTLSLEDMLKSSPICLLSKAFKTKSWLWHRRLSHLNLGTINEQAKQGLVKGLPKLKYKKDHLCSACSLGKSKKHTHKPKSENSIQEKLYLLHMDFYGLIRVESINGKKYILVIVDDYSRFTCVNFLRSKDETPEFIIKILKQVQVRLNATVINIRTDNGTKFVNQTLKSYYEDVGISHQTSVTRTPQQNDIIKRRNRTLVEAARTMLIFSKAQ
ncbi:retrovirus-related pol polyprotein from transposon TNT 1-94 [Tanacetum coccineum]